MVIKAPYNFVPLNQNVYFPKWAEQVSHDVPFSDGESGVIEVKITAKSPIFVRNGSMTDDNHFSNFNNTPFIPGTSIKGAIRNVFEIMTLSKMQFVDDRTFSWRDLGNENYTNNFTEKGKAGLTSEPKTNAGFIQIVNNEWQLIPCDYARIEQCDLDQQIGVSKISSVDKYDYWGNDLRNSLTDDFFVTEDTSNNAFIKQCGKFKRARLQEIATETRAVRGQIVFTGQIGPRNNRDEGEHGTGKKHLEFVFFDEEEDGVLSIPNTMKNDFTLNHTSERNREIHSTTLAPNEEWGFWKEKLENGGRMPVFWLGNTHHIESFGLAMLYRLPLKQSVHNQIKKSTSNHVKHIVNGKIDSERFQPDMTDLLFGYITDSTALKGRIQFSHAFLNNNRNNAGRESEVLAAPKATYYPNYLASGDYTTLNAIAGRKRYPIHTQIAHTENSANNHNIETEFFPLETGAEFICKIRFHNLLKVEIGALLSALTFHDTNDCFHSIGMAKPLGYGKVSFNLSLDNSLKYQKEEYLKEIETTLTSFLMEKNEGQNSNLWAKDLKELTTMASEQGREGDNILFYMSLSQFQSEKNANNRLKRYSEIPVITEKSLNSFLTTDEITTLYNKANEKKIKQKEIDDRKKMLNSDINHIANSEMNDEKEEDFMQRLKEFDNDINLVRTLFGKINKKKDELTYNNNYKILAEMLGEQLPNLEEIAQKQKLQKEEQQRREEIKEQKKTKRQTPEEMAQDFLDGKLQSLSKKIKKKLSPDLKEKIKAKENEKK